MRIILFGKLLEFYFFWSDPAYDLSEYSTLRMSSINSASNRQPVLVAVAQHSSSDDAVYFVSRILASNFSRYKVKIFFAFSLRSSRRKTKSTHERQRCTQICIT